MVTNQYEMVAMATVSNHVREHLKFGKKQQTSVSIATKKYRREEFFFSQNNHASLTLHIEKVRKVCKYIPGGEK